MRAPSRRDAGRPRVGVSRCLLGDEVRYDGGHKRDARLLEALEPYVEWVPVCPEVEVGMGTPREPVQLVAATDGVAAGTHRVRLVGSYTAADWTDTMERWRRSRVRELKDARLAGFVLKRDSPSCGPDNVPVRIGSGAAASGPGLFAHAVRDAMPGLPIEDEAALRDARIRDDFVARVRAYHHGLCLRMQR